MEKFNSMEYKVFNLIKNGKTRNEIIAEKVTTPANLSLILTGIYKKTAEFVNYHSERGKFEELAAYLRNNPDISGAILLSEKADIEKIVLNALETVGNKIENDLQIMKAKAETLQDVYTEIYKGGVCLK